MKPDADNKKSISDVLMTLYLPILSYRTPATRDVTKNAIVDELKLILVYER